MHKANRLRQSSLSNRLSSERGEVMLGAALLAVLIVGLCIAALVGRDGIVPYTDPKKEANALAPKTAKIFLTAADAIENASCRIGYPPGFIGDGCAQEVDK